MLSRILGCVLHGIAGNIVEVETFISNGIPSLEIIGQGDSTIKESRERVKAAIKNSGFEFPNRKIVVNLSPALLRKQGTGFDLPIALGILVASGQVILNTEDIFKSSMFLGELSLDGSVKGVRGVISMMLEAQRHSIKKVFVAEENYKEASIVEDIVIVGVKSLKDVISLLYCEPPPRVQVRKRKSPVSKLPDFSEVKGHAEAKRALEIAASGGHSILMLGSPGSGKTMLARCLSGILPEMNYSEALETTQIFSICSKNSISGLISKRPFRAPHHSSTLTSLTGGGRFPKPGELSLAHNGVLFLDELPEFKGEALEALRQPLEDGVITVSRLFSSEEFPSKVMLVCAANPCRCGMLFDEGRCRCTPYQKAEYLSKISGPLLDRIDMNIQVASVSFSQIDSSEKGEKSAEIRERVNSARKIQERRFKNEVFNCNGWLPLKLFKKYCLLSAEAGDVLERVYSNKNFSGREYTRVIRVARTIADMDCCETIEVKHISEAIQFKQLKWGEEFDYAGKSDSMDLVFTDKRSK